MAANSCWRRVSRGLRRLDFNRSTAFYDQALAPLGMKRLFDVPPEHSGGVDATGYGDTRPTVREFRLFRGVPMRKIAVRHWLADRGFALSLTLSEC